MGDGFVRDAESGSEKGTARSTHLLDTLLILLPTIYTIHLNLLLSSVESNLVITTSSKPQWAICISACLSSHNSLRRIAVAPGTFTSEPRC